MKRAKATCLTKENQNCTKSKINHNISESGSQVNVNQFKQNSTSKYSHSPSNVTFTVEIIILSFMNSKQQKKWLLYHVA